ncbi:hypothetical protein IPN35_00160 [Candidatus Peregrinibacteria bacterium]|nr:MAG: hypothetical protein IPN35_00160 [Candidatus Peregrinibacteria bacterium]
MPKNKKPITKSEANILLSPQIYLEGSHPSLKSSLKKKKTAEKKSIEMIFRAKKKETSLENTLVFTKEKKEVPKKKLPPKKKEISKKEGVQPQKILSPFVICHEEKVPPKRKSSSFLKQTTSTTLGIMRSLGKKKEQNLPQATRLSRRIQVTRDPKENTMLEIDTSAQHLRLYRPEKKQYWKPRGTKSAPEQCISDLLRISPYKSLRAKTIPTQIKKEEKANVFLGMEPTQCHFRPKTPIETDFYEIYSFSPEEKKPTTSIASQEAILLKSHPDASTHTMLTTPIYSEEEVCKLPTHKVTQGGESIEPLEKAKETILSITHGESIPLPKTTKKMPQKKKVANTSFSEGPVYKKKNISWEIEKERHIATRKKKEVLQKTKYVPSCIIVVRKRPTLLAQIQEKLSKIRLPKREKREKEIHSESLILAVRKHPPERVQEEVLETLTEEVLQKTKYVPSCIIVVRKRPTLLAQIQEKLSKIRLPKREKREKEIHSESLILAVRKHPPERVQEEVSETLTEEVLQKTKYVPSCIIVVRKRPTLLAQIQEKLSKIRLPKREKREKEIHSESLILAVRKHPLERVQEEVSETLTEEVLQKTKYVPSCIKDEKEVNSSLLKKIFSFFGKKKTGAHANIPAIRALVLIKKGVLLPACIPTHSESLVTLPEKSSVMIMNDTPQSQREDFETIFSWKPENTLQSENISEISDEHLENTPSKEFLLSQEGISSELASEKTVQEEDTQYISEEKSSEPFIEEHSASFFEKWKNRFQKQNKTDPQTPINETSAFDTLFFSKNGELSSRTPLSPLPIHEELTNISQEEVIADNLQTRIPQELSESPKEQDWESSPENEISFMPIPDQSGEQDVAELPSLSKKETSLSEEMREETSLQKEKNGVFEKLFSRKKEEVRPSSQEIPPTFEELFSHPSFFEEKDTPPETNAFSELSLGEKLSEAPSPSEEAIPLVQTDSLPAPSLPEKASENVLSFSEEKEIPTHTEIQKEENPFLEALPGLSPETPLPNPPAPTPESIPENDNMHGEENTLAKMLGNISQQKEEEVQVLGNEFAEELRQKNEKKKEANRAKRREDMLALSRFVCVFSIIAPLCVWVYHEARLNPNSGLSETIQSENYGSALVNARKQEEVKKTELETLKQAITKQETDINKIRNNQYLVDITQNRVDFIAVMLRIKDITFETLKINEKLNQKLKYIVFNSYSGTTSNGRTNITITGSVRDAKGMSWTQLTRLMEAINNDEYFDGAVIRNFSKADDEYGGAVSQFSFNLTYAPPPAETDTSTH